MRTSCLVAPGGDTGRTSPLRPGRPAARSLQRRPAYRGFVGRGLRPPIPCRLGEKDTPASEEPRRATAERARTSWIARRERRRSHPHPDPEVHTEVNAAQAEAARRLRGLAAAHGVPHGPDTPPADLIEPLLVRAGDDAETVHEIREAETALTRRAVVAVTRRRTVGVHLDAHGICMTTRTRRWALIRAEDSAAASAAALAALGVSVTGAKADTSAWRGQTPPSQGPPPAS